MSKLNHLVIKQQPEKITITIHATRILIRIAGGLFIAGSLFFLLWYLPEHRHAIKPEDLIVRKIILYFFVAVGILTFYHKRLTFNLTGANILIQRQLWLTLHKRNIPFNQFENFYLEYEADNNLSSLNTIYVYSLGIQSELIKQDLMQLQEASENKKDLPTKVLQKMNAIGTMLSDKTGKPLHRSDGFSELLELARRNS